MTAFAVGDQVRITAKGRKVAKDRQTIDWSSPCPDASHAREVTDVYGKGRTHQVYVMRSWWPASSWEKI